MAMLVTPRPGVILENLLRTLQSVHDEAYSLLGGSGAPTEYKRLLAYLEWTSRSARTLCREISEADLAALVLNRRYELLLSSFGTMASPEQEVQRVVNDLVTMELEQRITDFEDAINTLKSEREHWSRMSFLALPDSSFYIRHPDKLQDVDFARLLDTRQQVDVIIPIVVVDELDGLKQHSKQHVRWRAGVTLAVLDRVLAATPGPAILQEADFSTLTTGGIPRFRVTVELLFDPPGHVRLPINDDEIIDRAVAIQALAGRAVTMITYDTGQATRARNAELRVLKLSENIGDEPKSLERRNERPDWRVLVA
jgi:hypothetical protein